MWLTSSSIGRNLVMALSGAFLVLFVTFHALMNGVALFWPSAYNVVCEFLGANWYALVGTLVLAAGVVVHIIFATWLTLQNRKARGNERYAVTSRPKQVEWSSKNMLVLGVVVVAFLLVHLIQFWAKMQLAEIAGFQVMDGGEAVPAAAGTWFLQIAFSQWWTLPVYLIGFIALWFHMTHGFWSMMQTIGWDNDTWMNRLKCIGNTWTTVVIGLFVAEAVVFTINANAGNYTECPKLQQQYVEMLKAHEGAEAPCMFSEGCPKAAACPKAEACEKCADCDAACAADCTNCPNEGKCNDCKGAQCANKTVENN